MGDKGPYIFLEEKVDITRVVLEENLSGSGKMSRIAPKGGI